MIGPIGVLRRDLPVPVLLGPNQVITLQPNSYYDTIPPDSLRLWCYQNARYGIPTVELVAWLQQEIGHRRAIEIGSGTGDLCFHLGIQGTDNGQQAFSDVKALYDLTQQPTIQYPDFVERLSAEDAIDKYQPEVVIASWVTQWVDERKPIPAGGGNRYGVREDLIVRSGITYILIGNLSVHGTKEIMSLPHVELALPFLRSRSATPELNRVWIWNGNHNGGIE